MRGALARGGRNRGLLAQLGLRAGTPAGEGRAALYKKSWSGNLPIHDALRDEATGPELVRAMLDAGGEAMLAVPGFFKFLPLHVAARNSPFPAVVALLLASGPAGSARAEGEGGRPPFVPRPTFGGAARLRARAPARAPAPLHA